MAAATTNVTISTTAWAQVAAGAGEFNIEMGCPAEWALAGSAPADALRGHKIKPGVALPLNLPAAVNLYVRAVDGGQGGASVVIVTSGQ